MKLSVIIPVYNVEAFVGRTLESVFGTTARPDDFEVIVINDGTEDRSMEVVRRFADRPNITILEQDNQGLSAARMKGLASAKGEFVWFVDSDDYLVEDGVGKVLKLLEEKPDAEVLMFPLKRTGDGLFQDDAPFTKEEMVVVEGKRVINEWRLPVCPVCRFVVRKSLTENQWLFFPTGLIHEDEYFGPVLMTLAEKICLLSEPVYVHLVHRPGSIMTTLTVRSCYDRVAIHRLLMDYMENALASSDRPWFRRYCAGRLVASYTSCPQFHGSQAFKRFVRSNGLFIWNQWRQAYPEVSMKKKIGRLSFFLMPGIRKRILKNP